MLTGLCKPWWKRHRRMMTSKKANVEKDLDIVRLIRSQRFNSICLQSLLTKDQRKFADKLADSVLPASSDAESGSIHDSDFSYVHSVTAADDLVSKSLLKMYRAPRAMQPQKLERKQLIKAKAKTDHEIICIRVKPVWRADSMAGNADNSILRLDNYQDLNESALKDDLT